MTPVRRQRLAWLAWAVLLVSALAAVSVLNGRAAATSRRDEGSAARFGFRLEQVASQIGIDFVHQAPTFDPQLEPIMPQVASTGASVAVDDFDRDGWLDFYVTNSGEDSANRLYRNKGDGTVVDAD